MKRLRRFIASLVILALPLQGQVAASMACHQSSPQPQVAAAAAAEQAVHVHSDGHAHVHGLQINDKAQSFLVDDASSLQSASADEASGCAVCAACCAHAALHSTPIKTSAISIEQSVLSQSITLITTAPPEKLLRPPRANPTI